MDDILKDDEIEGEIDGDLKAAAPVADDEVDEDTVSIHDLEEEEDEEEVEADEM